MKGAKRVILGLAALGMAAALGGCGILRGAGNTATDLNPEDDTYYTMWIHSGPGSSYYTEYEDNPAVKYAETMTWGEEDKSIFIDFVIPPANKEPDDLQYMYINGNPRSTWGTCLRAKWWPLSTICPRFWWNW